ncbi:unnamed protein product [Camellia sinensis]
MGSGGLGVESTKHSCGSTAGVEVSVDVVVEGVGGLGIGGGGASSDGSSEVINSNNGDGGGVQVTCFAEVLEDVTLHFQIMSSQSVSMHGLAATLPNLDAYMPLHLLSLQDEKHFPSGCSQPQLNMEKAGIPTTHLGYSGGCEKLYSTTDPFCNFFLIFYC